MRHRIFITGAAGYVGAMLAEQFAARPDVEKIIALDKEPLPDMLRDCAKIFYVEENLADAAWEDVVAQHDPDIVIHTAWQIRELYGKRELQWAWNVDGSDRVFDYAFSRSSVRKLIHFSTVASYGAYPGNTTEHRYAEDEPFRQTDYLYAEEKRITEEHLREKYEAARASGRPVPQVFIVRPAAITGPRGRFSRIRFGLQAALSGSLKGRGSFVYDLISFMVSWVPVTPKWLRQYVHEDDVTDIVAALAFKECPGDYEAFNLAPPGAAVYGKDMARAVGKRMLPVRPWMVRVPFFFMWHLTRGRVPTSRGSWKGYSYPIAVDGSKITRFCGFHYTYPSYEAFYTTEGRYEECVPKELRRRL